MLNHAFYSSWVLLDNCAVHSTSIPTSKKPLGFQNVVIFIFFEQKKMKKDEKYENIDKLWISIHKSTFILFQTRFPTLRNPDCFRNPCAKMLCILAPKCILPVLAPKCRNPIFILAPKCCVFAHFRSDSRISVLFVLHINRAGHQDLFKLVFRVSKF